MPEFASDDEAIARSRRRSAGQVADVRMMPDYGCSLPLWVVGDAAKALLNQRLSAEMVRDLRMWHEQWEAGDVYDTGWRSAELRDAWLAEGERLFERVERMLWSDFDVVPVFRGMR